jgi:hypothetical protein
MATFITVCCNDTEELVGEIETETPISIEVAQDWVEGFVEVIRLRDNVNDENLPVTILCNDEGRLRGLPRNTFASVVSGMFDGPPLCGDVLIGSTLDEEGNLIGLDDLQAKRIMLAITLGLSMMGAETEVIHG